eukprot:IDg13511t1
MPPLLGALLVDSGRAGDAMWAVLGRLEIKVGSTNLGRSSRTLEAAASPFSVINAALIRLSKIEYKKGCKFTKWKSEKLASDEKKTVLPLNLQYFRPFACRTFQGSLHEHYTSQGTLRRRLCKDALPLTAMVRTVEYNTVTETAVCLQTTRSINGVLLSAPSVQKGPTGVSKPQGWICTCSMAPWRRRRVISALAHAHFLARRQTCCAARGGDDGVCVAHGLSKGLRFAFISTDSIYLQCAILGHIWQSVSVAAAPQWRRCSALLTAVHGRR